MCGPHRRFAPLLPRTLRRIPQAVGTVATSSYINRGSCNYICFNTASGRYCCNKSDPLHNINSIESFNTASGRYCCNLERRLSYFLCCYAVSIPQAVGTVATRIIRPTIGTNCVCFNTASGRYCCNVKPFTALRRLHLLRFNTASGRYCCNELVAPAVTAVIKESGFNTASGRYCCNHIKTMPVKTGKIVSIPQAVGTVATVIKLACGEVHVLSGDSFNTASGRYCCNSLIF